MRIPTPITIGLVLTGCLGMLVLACRSDESGVMMEPERSADAGVGIHDSMDMSRSDMGMAHDPRTTVGAMNRAPSERARAGHGGGFYYSPNATPPTTDNARRLVRRGRLGTLPVDPSEEIWIIARPALHDHGGDDDRPGCGALQARLTDDGGLVPSLSHTRRSTPPSMATSRPSTSNNSFAIRST